MLHLSAHCTYYFYQGAVDMRKGFDSLSGLVQQHMQLSVLSGSIFIFMNKKRNQVKLLLWEGDGLSLYYKRLEQGSYEQPRDKHAQWQLSDQRATTAIYAARHPT
jgi:transposase